MNKKVFFFEKTLFKSYLNIRTFEREECHLFHFSDKTRLQ